MERGQSMIKAVVLMTILYAIQFLIFPRVFPNYFRISNEATALYWISFTAAVLVGIRLKADHIIDWIPGNIIYLICMKTYSANGAYNAQLDEPRRIKWLIVYILIYMAEFIILQLFLIGVAGVVRRMVH